MPRYLIAQLLSAFLLAACSTQPKLAMPDGRSRVPVNTRAAIDEYNAAVERDQRKARDEAQQRQLAAVKRDLAELKALMAEGSPQQNSSDGSQRISAPLRVTAARAGAPVPPEKGSQLRDSETITVRDRSTLFTISPRVGETRFAPSTGFQRALNAAATKSTRIEIRGGAEVPPMNLENAKTADARRQNARRYLISIGIDPAKVKSTLRPAAVSSAGQSTSARAVRKPSLEIEVVASAGAASVAKAGQFKGAAQ